MSHSIEVASGKTLKLPTAGKYCDRDIVVAGFGSDAADLQAKYNEGVTVGEANGAAICAAKHFVYNFVGDGSDTASFRVPFEPDSLTIISYDPFVTNVAGGLMLFNCDLRAFGMPGGAVIHGTGGGSINTMSFGTRKITGRYSRTDDGIVTVKNTGYQNIPVVYGNGFIYTAVAVKYTEQTDKERITAFVNRLTGSGTVTLNKAKVNAAFTDDEWAALIATKPNWTFALS